MERRRTIRRQYTVTKVLSVDAINRKEAEKARLYYIASLIVLLAQIFFPEDYLEALDRAKSHLREEILMEICRILETRKDIMDDEFYDLYDSIARVAYGWEWPEEFEPVPYSVLERKHLAAIILSGMNSLSTPLDIPKDTPGFDF